MDTRNYRNFGGRRKSLTSLVLLVLEKAVDGYVSFDDFIHHPLWERKMKKSALSQAIARLREQGLVELISDKDMVLRLTDEGKTKALLVSLQQQEDIWDGRWRIVIFDIPEKRRIARDLLRYRLKQWGFAPWQQSVWVTKKNCTKPLREYIKKIGIMDWVMVIESDNIS